MSESTAGYGVPEIQDLYARYAECICDDELERWPDFFTEDCLYKLTSRVNADRGLPLAPILAESRGALMDRVMAIRHTMVYAPRYVTHQISGIRLVDRSGDILRTRSMFAIYQTLVDGTTHLQMAGRTFDKVLVGSAEPKFAERVVVYDTELLPGSVVYPV